MIVDVIASQKQDSLLGVWIQNKLPEQKRDWQVGSGTIPPQPDLFLGKFQDSMGSTVDFKPRGLFASKQSYPILNVIPVARVHLGKLWGHVDKVKGGIFLKTVEEVSIWSQMTSCEEAIRDKINLAQMVVNN